MLPVSRNSYRCSRFGCFSFDITCPEPVLASVSASKLYITVYGTGTNDPVLTNDTGVATESGVAVNNYVHSYANTNAAGASVTANVLSNDKESVAASANVIGSGYVAQVGLQGSATAPVAVDTDSSRSTVQSATINGAYGSLQINDNGAYTYTVLNTNAAVEALLDKPTVPAAARSVAAAPATSPCVTAPARGADCAGHASRSTWNCSASNSATASALRPSLRQKPVERL